MQDFSFKRAATGLAIGLLAGSRGFAAAQQAPAMAPYVPPLSPSTAPGFAPAPAAFAPAPQAPAFAPTPQPAAAPLLPPPQAGDVCQFSADPGVAIYSSSQQAGVNRTQVTLTVTQNNATRDLCEFVVGPNERVVTEALVCDGTETGSYRAEVRAVDD